MFEARCCLRMMDESCFLYRVNGLKLCDLALGGRINKKVYHLFMMKRCYFSLLPPTDSNWWRSESDSLLLLLYLTIVFVSAANRRRDVPRTSERHQPMVHRMDRSWTNGATLFATQETFHITSQVPVPSCWPTFDWLCWAPIIRATSQ